MENKPLKRDPALQDLSRHHHHGLVIATRCARARTLESKEEIRALLEDLLEFWHGGGAEHFREEEDILIPAYGKHANISAPEVVKMLKEHGEIRGMVERIEGATETDLGELERLGVCLRDHIRYEERVVFPMMQETIPPAELSALAPLFHDLGPTTCKSFARHPRGSDESPQ